jgi:ADP-ribose pyrophosphatase YjhB (NUDIX family)
MTIATGPDANTDCNNKSLDVADMLWNEFKSIDDPGAKRGAGGLDERLRAFYQQVHELKEGRAALCLSGGGMRSAAFSLGVLQALASHGKALARFHYLSTVSGGGYIGAWLTAWIHRSCLADQDRQDRQEAIERVVDCLGARSGRSLGAVPASHSGLVEEAQAPSQQKGGEGGSPADVPEIAHLRRFTAFLTPSGFDSREGWTLIAIYLRNLLLIWLILLPLLGSAIAVPHVLASALRAGGVESSMILSVEAPKIWAVAVIPLALALGFLGIALISALKARRRQAVEGEPGTAAMGVMLRLASGWTAFAGAVLLAPALLGLAPRLVEASGGVAAIATWLLNTLGGRRSSGEPPEQNAGPPLWIRLATPVSASVAIIVLIALLSVRVEALIGALASTAAGDGVRQDISRVWAALLVVGGLLVLSALAGCLVNVNEFSLHAMYRYRLARAFLAASHEKGVSDGAHREEFEDFDLADLWPNDKDSNAGDPSRPRYLFHVINAALNDVAGTRAEWRERKALSFTMSPLYSGAHVCPAPDQQTQGGYHSQTMGAADGMKRSPRLTLGTAIAISGAAASPNMGYYSSKIAAFLMTLFNMRLGWWMRSPWRDSTELSLPTTPVAAWRALTSEAFGRTRYDSEVVYLSDGGHFENLGLYEMVRRRCRYILVVDAGCDHQRSYWDLGNALRRIRIDFGIEITLHSLDLSTHQTEVPVSMQCGRIWYSKKDAVPDDEDKDGILIYVKPTITGDEPADVQSYYRFNRTFPHETTADQWFSESQFESYRRLGEHTITRVITYYELHKGAFIQSEEPIIQWLFHAFREASGMMKRQGSTNSHAGGVIYRRREDKIEFLLVESMDQSKWVLPKGHIEPGENARTAAQREVREETGFFFPNKQEWKSLGIHTFSAASKQVACAYFLMNFDGPKEERKAFEPREPRWLTADESENTTEVPPDIPAVLKKAVKAIGTLASDSQTASLREHTSAQAAAGADAGTGAGQRKQT